MSHKLVSFIASRTEVGDIQCRLKSAVHSAKWGKRCYIFCGRSERKASAERRMIIQRVTSGELPSPLVPGYVTMDFRIAWLATEGVELSFVGEDLFQESHPEFGLPVPTRREVERSFYGKVTWMF